MADRQIFYDPSGRRRKRFTLAIILFVLLNLLTIAALFATIRVVPAQAPLPVALEHGVAQPTPKSSLLARTSRRFDLAIRRLLGTQPPSPRKVGARKATAVATAMSKPLYVGFYAPWDESSTSSLQRHIGDLDWLAPVWVTVTGPKHNSPCCPTVTARAVINSAPHRPLILPVVQNFTNGQVDRGGRIAARRPRHGGTSSISSNRSWSPIMHRARCSTSSSSIASGTANYLELLREARLRFARHGWLVTVAAPVDEAWDLAAFRCRRRQAVPHGL